MNNALTLTGGHEPVCLVDALISRLLYPAEIRLHLIGGIEHVTTHTSGIQKALSKRGLILTCSFGGKGYRIMHLR